MGAKHRPPGWTFALVVACLLHGVAASSYDALAAEGFAVDDPAANTYSRQLREELKVLPRRGLKETAGRHLTDATSVTVVKTFQELLDAWTEGAAHIEVQAHLDSTTFPLIDVQVNGNSAAHVLPLQKSSTRTLIGNCGSGPGPEITDRLIGVSLQSRKSGQCVILTDKPLIPLVTGSMLVDNLYIRFHAPIADTFWGEENVNENDETSSMVHLHGGKAWISNLIVQGDGQTPAGAVTVYASSQIMFIDTDFVSLYASLTATGSIPTALVKESSAVFFLRTRAINIKQDEAVPIFAGDSTVRLKFQEIEFRNNTREYRIKVVRGGQVYSDNATEIVWQFTGDADPVQTVDALSLSAGQVTGLFLEETDAEYLALQNRNPIAVAEEDTDSADTTTDKSKKKSSPGAVIGAAVGVSLVVILGAIAAGYFCWKKRRAKAAAGNHMGFRGTPSAKASEPPTRYSTGQAGSDHWGTMPHHSSRAASVVASSHESHPLYNTDTSGAGGPRHIHHPNGTIHEGGPPDNTGSAAAPWGASVPAATKQGFVPSPFPAHTGMSPPTPPQGIDRNSSSGSGSGVGGMGSHLTRAGVNAGAIKATQVAKRTTYMPIPGQGFNNMRAPRQGGTMVRGMNRMYGMHGAAPPNGEIPVDERLEYLHDQLDSLLKKPILSGLVLQEGPENRLEGGQAMVIFATHEVSKVEYAIKLFVSPAAFADEQALYSDATSPLRLLLPAARDIVPNEDGAFVDAHGQPMPPCIVMEKGESLDLWMQRNRRAMDPFTCMQILYHVCECLMDLHKDGYVHRDLKPANVMWLPSQNRWTIIDFGCAAEIDSEARMGFSLQYAAPEVVTGVYKNGNETIKASTALDAWSVGILAVELFTGMPALRLIEGEDKVVRQVTGETALPWEGVDGGRALLKRSGKLRSHVLRLLHRDPNQRLSVQSFVQICSNMLSSNTQQSVGTCSSRGSHGGGTVE